VWQQLFGDPQPGVWERLVRMSGLVDATWVAVRDRTRHAPGRVVFRTVREVVRREAGSGDACSTQVSWRAHWLGVALAAPVAGVILLASWRAFAARRTRRPDPKEESS
jgi:hypothetical protein